jgi:hypothetical protein
MLVQFYVEGVGATANTHATHQVRVGLPLQIFGGTHKSVAVFVDYLSSPESLSRSAHTKRMFVSRRTSPTTELTALTGSPPKSKMPFFASSGQMRLKRRFSPRRSRMIPHHSPVINWMSSEGGCPSDVVPKILAFCGPQMVALLSQTNRHWRDVCLAESTWRILCEDLYKVRYHALMD